ncbi:MULTISPECIES: hypothetical protein [unclassified Mycobacterium]|uniref:hypothetical protein n=1 Tax=Mycobacterium sp. DL99 TaxID=2528957 RepID=UPI001081F0B7|nr:hypothetical protein [Mycobacterium sp. DL99]
MTCNHTETVSCTCDSCITDLASNPFLALRVAYGMLLGEDDFRVLAGNPRGKQMLHSAWLHRSGVVWGYQACIEGRRELRVTAGLAIDGLGRELIQETSWCVDLRDWVEHHGSVVPEGCGKRKFTVCLEVAFDCCRTAPVPTLADPCDVSRKHDDYSRVVETSKLSLRPGHCITGPQPYHRVRVLLGIDDVGECDPAGEQALHARHRAAAAPPGERPEVLLAAFRALAALDVAEIAPPDDPMTGHSTMYPVLPECAAVALACVTIVVDDSSGCLEVVDAHVDPACRTTLLPTATIQELLCGLAPAVIGPVAEDAGGPRVRFVEWSQDETVCTIHLTKPLNPGSAGRRAVRITSLSHRGWVDEDVDTVHYRPGEERIVVTLADAPAYDTVRVIIHGTGPTPVFGEDPSVPLAGLVDDPPGSRNDGHDAVLVFEKPLYPTEAAQ